VAPRQHLAHVPSFRDNPIVFFTVCTHQRKTILANTQCHDILRAVWAESAHRQGWWVGQYIIMPDHVHFFARPETDADQMAKWLQMWKGVTSRQIAKTLGIRPPIWQADYFDRYLRSADSYSEKWDYVELNAVRAGLVQRVADWAYRGVIHDLLL
jgi:REP element-mobilizing transposase RayT